MDKNTKEPEQLDLLEASSDEEVIEFDANELDFGQDDDTKDDNEEKDAEPRKSSRAEKRIRDLVRTNKELETQLNEIKAEKKKAEKANKETVSSLQVSKVESELASATAAVTAAKGEVAAAVSSGNDDTVAQAYENLAQAVALRQQYQSYHDYLKTQETVTEEEPVEEDKDEKPSSPPQQLTSHEKRWVAANQSWFKVDPIMTMTVQGVHEALISQGYQPTNEDDEEFGRAAYWDEVDRQMSDLFPGKYNKPSGGKKRVPVTPPANSPDIRQSKGKATVRLTPEMREMAKKLGVPEKRYAEELMKSKRKAQ